MTIICHACVDCGKERFVRLKKHVPENIRCRSCGIKLSYKTRDKSYFKRGSESHLWKGGCKIHNGYIMVSIDSSSPYYSMISYHNYIFEHRLIMAQYLGRCLDKSENIHHINGIKNDNRIENLKIVTNHAHRSEIKDMIRDAYLRGLEDGAKQRNDELLKEVRMLRWQMKEQSEQIRQLTSKLMGVGGE